ncbi:MAG: BON domain-containing protein [Anaerolineales bacterium]
MTVVSDVKKRVSKALAEDERTAEYIIDVVDDQGVVTLTGAVDAEDVSAAAAEIAQAQEGVVEVINDIEVRDPDVAEDIVTPPPDVRGGVRDV